MKLSSTPASDVLVGLICAKMLADPKRVAFYEVGSLSQLHNCAVWSDPATGLYLELHTWEWMPFRRTTAMRRLTHRGKAIEVSRKAARTLGACVDKCIQLTKARTDVDNRAESELAACAAIEEMIL